MSLNSFSIPYFCRKAKTLDESDTLKEKARILKKIADSCKMVNYKNNLIKECKPLFIVDD